jgi:hypothetical protein
MRLCPGSNAAAGFNADLQLTRYPTGGNFTRAPPRAPFVFTYSRNEIEREHPAKSTRTAREAIVT